MSLNKFEKWMLKRIFEKASIQGDHCKNASFIFYSLFEAWYKEFTEDTLATISEHLLELFTKQSEVFVEHTKKMQEIEEILDNVRKRREDELKKVIL